MAGVVVLETGSEASAALEALEAATTDRRCPVLGEPAAAGSTAGGEETEEPQVLVYGAVSEETAETLPVPEALVVTAETAETRMAGPVAVLAETEATQP